MKIKELEIENILSIEKASISFDDTGLILVEGWNHDSGRANGAGKSAIFNSLSFALFDKVPRKITASEILRRGTKSGFASATIESNGDTYTVKRTRPKGTEFTKNGVNINITQEEFEKIIKLTYDQFIISAYCAQSGSNRFISLNDADKKTFLLKLLDLDKFQELKKIADEHIKEISLAINVLHVKHTTAISKIEAYRESLIDRDEIAIQNNELTKEIEELQVKLLSIEEVPKPDLSHYISLENQLSLKEKEILIAKTTKTMLHNQYKKINVGIHEFEMSDTCLECGSTISTENARQHHDQKQESLKLETVSCKLQIDEQDVIVSRENDIHNMKSKIFAKKNKELESFNTASQIAINLNSLISKKQDLVESNNVKLLKDMDLLNKINKLSDLAAICEAQNDNKSKDLEFYKALSSIYSPTGAPAYVLDSIVDSFNDTVIKYIELVWPTASYSLNSYKQTSKGDVVAKFSESLIMDGIDVSIGSLSGGELRALSLCVDFTVVEILQKNFGISINPIILDEPFDGLDASGKEVVIELLEKLSRDRSIIVIDHGSEAKVMFSKTIMVEKRGGISSLLTHLV